MFWASKYKQDMESIAHNFIPALYKKLFGKDAPCMSKRAMQTITRVANWFPITHSTFIRVFGSFKAPHALPEFVTDKLLLQEVCYQMTSGFSKVLTKGKKKSWPTLPIL